MIFPKVNLKANKNRIHNGFLLGQVLLGVMIIMIILLFGNKLYRDGLKQIKQYRLQAEIENMKEFVSNTIVRIDMNREAAKENVAELIEVCAVNAGRPTDDPVFFGRQILEKISTEGIGKMLYVLIEDGERFTLLNADNMNGVVVSQKDADSLLLQDAVRKEISMAGDTIHLFALQTDIDTYVKEREYALIHNQQFAEDSYIWVNEVLNMEGGENYAVRRIHPNLMDTEGEYLSTSMQDIMGNYPYEVELDGIRENGEVVHQYYFKNKSNDQIGEKVSYAAFYEPFQWIVAMGTPLDALYSDIEDLTQTRMVTFSVQIAFVCTVVMILLLFSIRKTISSLSYSAEVAEKANKAKSVFLSNMSHDIRTPMNAIIGFTNIALRHPTEPEVKCCLEKIGESSDHLLTLINDVLDISRIESGKTKYTPSPVDITKVTDAVLDITKGFLINRNLKFDIRRAKLDKPYVMADTVRIREVLVNILGNAVKFTPDGGTIWFQTEYFPGEDDCHIIVRYRISDTGVGMSEEFLGQVFDDFAQEENGARTQYKGTGLGMAITKQYVDLMGGTISVESKKGNGSTFTVDLPLEMTSIENIDKQEMPQAKENLRGIRVLLAEDNDLNAEIAEIQLEELGMKVTRANDGKQAVKLFSDNPADTFDVILMDIMMPQMNGYEATKAIRSLSNRPDGCSIPIIAMTANAFAEDVQASLDAGMNGHLSKPIVMDEVIKTISRNLDR